MIETIIIALLPIVVTLMLGFFAGWHQDFNKEQATVLNRMVMIYALPLMLFAGILSTPLTEILKDADVVLWLAIGMIGGFIVFFALSRFVFREKSSVAALRALVIASPAIPFVGAPILGLLYPIQADLTIAIGGILINLIQSPLTLFFLVGANRTSGAIQESALSVALENVFKAVKQPVVWAPLLAFVLLLLGVELPKKFKEVFMLLGQSTGGVALFAIGAVLYAQKIKVSWSVAINVFCKNILLPVIILFAMIGMVVPEAQRGLVTVSLAMPTASVAVIFAVEYKVTEQDVATSLFFSTVLSVITMGVFIWLTA